VEEFSLGLVLGLDFLCDYRMELNIAKKRASFPTGHTTKLSAPPNHRFCNVKVLSRDRTVILPHRIKAVEIKASTADGIDYTFSPFTAVEKGMPISPQLMHTIIDKSTTAIMFSNCSEHPVVIEKDQQLGTAQLVLFGSRVYQTGSHINWNDLIALEVVICGSEGLVAIPGEQECFHVTLSTRPPWSIPDDEAASISASAQPRRQGKLFPSEDDGDTLPETSPFAEGILMVSPHLSETQRNKIGLILEEFLDCFSDGKSIGHAFDYSVPINTGKNPLHAA